jgi:hypothetical protein
MTTLSGGPSSVAIVHRMDQAIAEPQKSYLFENERGDTMCGRALTGICTSDPEYARLPPHFVNSFRFDYGKIIDSIGE